MHTFFMSTLFPSRSTFIEDHEGIRSGLLTHVFHAAMHGWIQLLDHALKVTCY